MRGLIMHRIEDKRRGQLPEEWYRDVKWICFADKLRYPHSAGQARLLDITGSLTSNDALTRQLRPRVAKVLAAHPRCRAQEVVIYGVGSDRYPDRRRNPLS